MGSTRLPEKVLKPIQGRPMLAWVVARTSAASLLDDTVVATSTKAQDDEVAAFCDDQDIPRFRGDEADVLDRYYQTAVEYDADTVVRITADCPLTSPSFIDRAIRVYNESDVDYASNKIDYAQPDGLDVEVFGFEALQTSWEEATADPEREHVTLYIRNRDAFESCDVSNPVDTSEYSVTDDDTILRWTVDYPSDLEFIREIYRRLHRNRPWTIDQVAVFELLEREPELLELTDHATPDEYN
jgi:spore coat polysaccharide biosynthesis protein SpsF (cytidylyltransferase family)